MGASSTPNDLRVALCSSAQSVSVGTDPEDRLFEILARIIREGSEAANVRLVEGAA